MQAVPNGPRHKKIRSTVLITGRTSDNSPMVNDPEVPPHHVEIRPEEQGYSITDLGSANDIFVNDQQLDHNVPCVLNSGDIIRIGEIQFAYNSSSQQPDGQLAGAPNYSAAVDTTHTAQTQKKSRRGLLILVGIVGAILLIGIIAFGALAYVNRSTPTKTLTMFCNALKAQDYQAAYDQLSMKQQHAGSETEFATSLRKLFALGLGLNNCTISNVNEGSSSPTGVMIWSLNIRPTQPFIFDTRFVNENNVWKIDYLKARTTTP